MAAPRSVADYLLQRLREWQVDKVFGCSGPGPAGLPVAWDGAWDRAGDRPGFVQAGREESGVLEAVGHARLSGRLGVCAACAGPGAMRLLTGLHEARADQVPILAIVGGTGRGPADDRNEAGDEDTDQPYRPTIDLPNLFRGVVGESVHVLTAPEHLPRTLDRAIRQALADRAPSVLVIPPGMQSLPVPAYAYEALAMPSVTGFEWSSVLPATFAILRAAEVLNSGRRVAVLVGTGGRGAHEEIEYVADLLGAGVATSLHGKDVLSDDLPYVTGPIGPFGTGPSADLMSGCDTLLTIGLALPPARYLPRVGRVRAVQIDDDARRIGTSFPTEVDLVGDAAATLRALIPHLRSKDDQTWREDVEAKVRQWRRVVEAEALAEAGVGVGIRAGGRAEPTIKPGKAAAKPGNAGTSNPPTPVSSPRAFAELSSRLPDDAVVAAESGTAAALYARHLRFRGGMRGVLPADAASSAAAVTAGAALPLGIGAKFADPRRPVVVFATDAAMQTNGLADLLTIKRHWRRWADPRFIVAVLRDIDPVADPGREPGGGENGDAPLVDYAAFVSGLGFHAITVAVPDHLGRAWEQALASDRPTLVDIRIDAESMAALRALQAQALLPHQYRPLDS